MDLERLERIAKDATEGPWSYAFRTTVDGTQWAVFDKDDVAIASNNDGRGEDARHFSNFDPPTVLALIDQVKNLETELRKAQVKVLLEVESALEKDGHEYFQSAQDLKGADNIRYHSYSQAFISSARSIRKKIQELAEDS